MFNGVITSDYTQDQPILVNHQAKQVPSLSQNYTCRIRSQMRFYCWLKGRVAIAERSFQGGGFLLAVQEAEFSGFSELSKVYLIHVPQDWLFVSSVPQQKYSCQIIGLFCFGKKCFWNTTGGSQKKIEFMIGIYDWLIIIPIN